MEKFRPVRHHSRDATPFLRKNFKRFCQDIPKGAAVADLGCGNMRNSDYLRTLGYNSVYAFDRSTDVGIQADLTHGIPMASGIAGIILCQYVLCFLNSTERRILICEMCRIATEGCVLFVELYPAKKGYRYDDAQIVRAFQNGGWECLYRVKDRFVMRKHSEG